jgi:uncharacterized membrane protein
MIQPAHKQRIIGYDFARALAVFGMVVVNFVVVMGAEANGPLWLQRVVGLLEGRAAATFVILAGVGLSLFSQKARLHNDMEGVARHRNALAKRALFLFYCRPFVHADLAAGYSSFLRDLHRCRGFVVGGL